MESLLRERVIGVVHLEVWVASGVTCCEQLQKLAAWLVPLVSCRMEYHRMHRLAFRSTEDPVLAHLPRRRSWPGARDPCRLRLEVHRQVALCQSPRDPDFQSYAVTRRQRSHRRRRDFPRRNLDDALPISHASRLIPSDMSFSSPSSQTRVSRAPLQMVAPWDLSSNNTPQSP